MGKKQKYDDYYSNGKVEIGRFGNSVSVSYTHLIRPKFCGCERKELLFYYESGKREVRSVF